MTDLSKPSLAVVGAGPGGLLAARILQLGGVDVAVYDADASLESRDRGGTLDLHADSGQIALQDALLIDKFTALARPEGQAHRLLDPQGTVLAERTPSADEAAAPEIDRAQLRRMIADSLTPGTIRWGRRVTDVTPGTLTFEDGSVESADLVIGADGAWSRVRKALTDAAPMYTGVTFVEALFTNVTERHPEIAALVGDGHMWANGDGKTLVLQRNSGDAVRGYISFRTQLDWLTEAGLGAADGRGGILDSNGTTATDTERIRAVLRNHFAEFSPKLLRVIDDTEGTLPNRPIFALRTPMTLTHQPGITLLGDAAHVMSPFGGNGVNLALLDGAEIARVTVNAIRTWTAIDEAVQEYEERMVLRGAAIGKLANDAIVEHYAVGGPDIDNIPNFDDAADQWRANAAEYRAHRD